LQEAAVDVQEPQDCPVATSTFRPQPVAVRLARPEDQDQDLQAQDRNTFHLPRERLVEVVEMESSILRQAIAIKRRRSPKTPIKSLNSKKCHYNAGCPKCSFTQMVNLFM